MEYNAAEEKKRKRGKFGKSLAAIRKGGREKEEVFNWGNGANLIPEEGNVRPSDEKKRRMSRKSRSFALGQQEKKTQEGEEGKNKEKINPVLLV